MVNVNLGQAVITSNKEHIVVNEEIKDVIASNLNIKKEKVVVYG